MTTTIQINGQPVNPMSLSPEMRHMVIAQIEAKYSPEHPANVYADSIAFKQVNEWIANFCHAWEGQGLGVFSVEIEDSTKPNVVERIEKILAKAELGGAFLVNVHPQYSNLYEVKHNARRASAAHERYDMHAAGEALRKGGFEADISNLTLLVRKAVRQPPRFTGDDYEAYEAQYSGAHDIEYADMF